MSESGALFPYIPFILRFTFDDMFLETILSSTVVFDGDKKSKQCKFLEWSLAMVNLSCGVEPAPTGVGRRQ
jgi:hypothetical protein